MTNANSAAEVSALAKDERLITLNILGLSPLLAISDNFANSLALGAATLLVSVLACLSCAVIRDAYYHQWRLAVYLVILASYTSLVALLIERYFYTLHLQLGLYLPLICCNTALLVTMETECRSQKPLVALLSGARVGLIFLGIIAVFGLIREWLTSGSLASLEVLTAIVDSASTGESTITSESTIAGEAIAIVDAGLLGLQPGAFILLGLIVAAWNMCSRWHKRSLSRHSPEEAVDPVKRVRIVLRP